MHFRFSKKHKVTKSCEYRIIKKMGCSLYTLHFVLLFTPTSCDNSRIGITVSKKIGNAVKRNKIKRLIREFFRINSNMFSKKNYVVIVRKPFENIVKNDFNNELKILFLRAKTI